MRTSASRSSSPLCAPAACASAPHSRSRPALSTPPGDLAVGNRSRLGPVAPPCEPAAAVAVLTGEQRVASGNLPVGNRSRLGPVAAPSAPAAAVAVVTGGQAVAAGNWHWATANAWGRRRRPAYWQRWQRQWQHGIPWWCTCAWQQPSHAAAAASSHASNPGHTAMIDWSTSWVQ